MSGLIEKVKLFKLFEKKNIPEDNKEKKKDHHHHGHHHHHHHHGGHHHDDPEGPQNLTLKEKVTNELSLVVDAGLRLLLLIACLVAVAVLVSGDDISTVATHIKFGYSGGFVYFVVAFSLTGLYSVITGVASLFALCKPGFPAIRLMHLVSLDVFMLAVVASATGVAGGVGYVGLRGNSHLNWYKICGLYGKFCVHLAGSIAVSLLASLVLMAMIIINTHAIYRQAQEL